MKLKKYNLGGDWQPPKKVDKFLKEEEKVMDSLIKPLITNDDIKILYSSRWQDLNVSCLIQYKNALETKIQSHARNHFIHLKQEIIWANPKAAMEFVQIDNGGKLKDYGRIQKWREGSCSGFPDVMIMLALNGKQKTLFIEFKRIGSASQIRISDEQRQWNKNLNNMGFSAYITNNPIFFEKEICKEIRKFFASATDTERTHN